MIPVGQFSEMKVYPDNGSVKNFLCEKVNYDKEKIIKYLKNGRRAASCPRPAIDCITGREISASFSCFDDGNYCWGDYLIYHIRKYNIKLPDEFLEHINRKMK